ncbi:hypothetical protein KKF61_01395 [Patescibacteria group bacterium]|nr:hypothetical protein [Patescibacteria group bacterium]MBU0963874.1 hypothetical protein [Patescibacteria group bacterium]
MRVYFFSPTISTIELDQNYKKIVETIKQSGVFVVASSDENNTDFKKEELEQMTEAGEILLDKMDCFIVEASKPDQEIGYLLAYAISQKKPLLYLYQKGTPEKVAHGYLTKKNTPDFVIMKSYTKTDLEQKVLDFINDVSQGKGIKEKPNIKFTLRITSRMERYMQYKSKRLKKTKADFIREILEKMMGEDGDFKDK